MLVLVTGGAGYIGSVAVAELITSGYDVAVLDNLSLGHRQAVHPQAKIFELDLADKAQLSETLSKLRPEAILHFASRSQVGQSMQQPFLYLHHNVSEGLNLLEAAVTAGVHRFILSSTANLYDQPQKIPIDETEALIPGSPYGEAKHYLERALFWLNKTHGLKFAVLRYFNAAGATTTLGEDHRPETHLIPLVLQVALGQRSKITIFGDQYPTRDGTCVRDYIHVTDLAQAHILALQALDTRTEPGLFYNLGNGSGYTVREVIDTATRITGHSIAQEIGPARAGDVAALVASSEKIRHELGWQPRYPDLESIVATAWDWHRRHPRGYGE
ncbi:MAG: UDP-glucose 4-epimerase GalE [Pirellulales bacterium]|nr:UDP-glucose 4-epimerase GalE [Pirellulales bacterium]